MKLSVNLFMTLNGVCQAPGGPDEDTRGGFTDGGWLFTVWDDQCERAVNRWFNQCHAFLLGRTTYDIFAGYWPQVTDPENGIATKLNTSQKYVVTSSPVNDAWTSTTETLGQDYLNGIVKLKATDSAKELQVHGSIQLARTLHEAGLVDLYRFLIAPVTVGQGFGLFNGPGPSFRMHVQHGTVTDNGVFDVELTPDELQITQTAAVEDGKDSREDIS